MKNPDPHPSFFSDTAFENELAKFMKRIGALDKLFYLFSFTQILQNHLPNKSIFDLLDPIFLADESKIEQSSSLSVPN